MKNFKHILSIILVGLVIGLNLIHGTSASAVTLQEQKVETIVVPSEVAVFANSQFKGQISSVINDPNNHEFKKDELLSSYLGQPFSIYCYEDSKIIKNDIYYFPVISNADVIALYAVAKVDSGKYTTTFTKSFGDKLDGLLENNNAPIKLMSVENDIYAISGTKEILLATDYTKNSNLTDEEIKDAKSKVESYSKGKDKKTVNVKEKLGQATKTKSKIVQDPETDSNLTNEEIKDAKSKVGSYSNMENELTVNNKETLLQATGTDSLSNYKMLSVPIVLQGAHPWCAGATSAAILNYKKGTNLSARDIITHVYGSAVEKGLNADQIKKVFDDYGYGVIKTSPLSYNSVQFALKNNWPINMLMYSSDSGHSMILTGFFEYQTGEKYYSLIDPNYSNYVGVIAYNSGTSVSYILNNKVFSWQQSIL